jgi:hypothetical protein
MYAVCYKYSCYTMCVSSYMHCITVNGICTPCATKKFLLHTITGLSKQDHVLVEPPHRGSVDSVQQIICAQIKDIKMSCWLNVQHVSISIVIIPDMSTNTTQLVCKQNTLIQMYSGSSMITPFSKIEQSGFYPYKVSTPDSSAQYLRNRMCNP